MDWSAVGGEVPKVWEGFRILNQHHDVLVLLENGESPMNYAIRNQNTDGTWYWTGTTWSENIELAAMGTIDQLVRWTLPEVGGSYLSIVEVWRHVGKTLGEFK
jgi:hypothetical protein